MKVLFCLEANMKLLKDSLQILFIKGEGGA
jgi:hypothetical protein